MPNAHSKRRRRAPFILCALAGTAAGFSTHASPTLVDWIDAVDGDWFDPVRWSGGVVPNNADGATYAARLGGASPYTVTLNASAAVSSLEFAVASTVRLNTLGDLLIHNTLALNAGTLDLRRGRVSGGVWTGAGGSVRFESGSSIENATLSNSMTMLGSFGGALLDLRNVTFADGANVRMGANNESFNLRGAVAIADGATVQAGGRLNGNSVVPTRTNLFDGATLTIDSGGVLAFASPGVIAGDGTGLLRNEGTLISGVLPPPSTLGPADSSSPMTWLAIESSAGEFQNDGRLAIGSAGITSIAAKFSNSGVVDVFSGALSLDGEWESDGDIKLLGPSASLVLGGVFSTASTESISHTLGSIFLDGVMNNSGAVTDLQSGNARWTARGAIIEGGTVDGRSALSQRAVVGVATLQDATLLTSTTWNLFSGDNITLERTAIEGAAFIGLDSGARLTLRESALPSSTLAELRSNSLLTFEADDATLVDTEVRLLSGSDITVRGEHSLVIDESSSIVAVTTTGTTVSGTQGARLLENRGSLRAEANPPSVSASFGNGFAQFVNYGEISNLSSGSVLLFNLTNAAQGVVNATGVSGELRFVGNLLNQGEIGAIGSDVSIAGPFTNYGSLNVQGADLTLGTTTGAQLSNYGTISLTDGTLTLGGEYDARTVGGITLAGDWSATAGGIWQNDANLLDLSALGDRWSLSGEIRGGTVDLGTQGTRAALDGATLVDATILGASITLGPDEDLGFEDSLLPLSLAIGASSGSTVRFTDTLLVGVDLASLATAESPAPTLSLAGASDIGIGSRVIGKWDIEGPLIVNRGLISGGVDADVSIRSTDLMLNEGTISSSGSIHITASTAITNRGSISAAEQVSLSASNILHTGQISASSISVIGATVQNETIIDAANLTLRSNTLENEGTIRAVNGSISVGGVNYGEIVVHGGGEVDLSVRAFGGPNFTNTGAIRVIGGSTLDLVDIPNLADGSLINAGTLYIDPTSTMRISREISSDALSGIVVDGLLDIQSTVTNTGRTFTNPGDGTIRVGGGSSGVIVGGVIDLNGDTLELTGPDFSSPRTRLNGVGVINTDISVIGEVTLANGFYLLNGSIDVGDELRVSNPFQQRLFADEIRLNGNRLTLENVASIASTTRIVGPGMIFNLSTGVVDNQGTIEMGQSGAMSFSGKFLNSGAIRAQHGSTLTFNDDLSNAGLLEATGGSLIDFNRLLSNSGVIEARDGSTLDLRGVFGNAGLPEAGTIRLFDSTLRWNSGFFNGDISLTRSDLRLSGSVFSSLLARFDLDGSSRLVLGDGQLATLNLENSHFEFDRDVVFLGALLRDGTFSLPNPLDGEIGLFLQNAQYLGGDIVLRGSSAFGATGDPNPNGIIRSMGDTRLHLAYTQSLATEFVHTSGHLALYADSNSTTRLEDRFAILGGSAGVTRSTFLAYMPTIINSGEFHVSSSSSQPTVFYSAIGAFDNRGVIDIGRGGRVEFDPRSSGLSSLANFDIASRTLTGGRYIIGDGGRLTLRGGVIETNNADVEIHGSGQFDALMQSIRRNDGSIAILNNANVITISSFLNEDTLRIEDSRLGAFSLVNNALFVGRDPDLDVAYLTLSADSRVELTITRAASQTAPLLSASLGGSAGGSLAIEIENAALFEWGDRFELVRIGGVRQGDFATVDGPASSDGLAWQTEWIGNSFFLRARDWADLDDNGVIDASDLAFVKDQYGQLGGDADIDGDGVVSFSDLNIVLSRFGASAPGRIVPSPGTATVSLLAAIATAAPRRRSRNSPPSAN